MQNLTETEFQAAIETGTVLVDFNAEWCGPCKQMAPVLEEFAARHGDVRVVGVDVDATPGLAGAYEVMSIPTLVLLQDQRVLGRLVGARPLARLEAEIAEMRSV